jgi:U3 small nucleolar RNA-associated protein 7
MAEDKEEEMDAQGTMAISRGTSDKEARKKHQDLKRKKRSPEDQALISKYQDETDSHKRRLAQLKEDDANPDISRLSGYQRRALEKRSFRKDKVVSAKLQIHKSKRLEAAVAAADAQVVLHTETPGMVESEHDMERTTNLTQVELKRNHLDEQTARHIFDLGLTEYSPYGCRYDRSGRSAILFGQRGHLALLDCHHLGLKAEFHVQERVRDACFLHNSTMLAVAQTNHVYIYDDNGAEIHKLSDHNDPFSLEFLPYHWLLASVGRSGWLKYQDTSTGQLVSEHRTKLGPCNVMRQNPSNAVIHLGHSNGTVTLWSPASSQYLVKLLCHKGSPVTSLAVDKSGHYMVTGGADRQVRVWDLRMYKETHAYFTSAGVPTSLDISQRNILGIGHAGHATFWSPQALTTKVKDPYMHHDLPACGPVETLRFRPFEDVCGIGHIKGISSIVIPGSGEPNLDSSEYNVNPNQDKKQRREAEVRALLDKLSPDMITLDPSSIGGMEESDPQRRLERLKDLQDQANGKIKKKKEKSKKRGRSKIQSKLARKQANVVDEQTMKLREAREKEKAEEQQEGSGKQDVKEEAPTALKRFF